MGQMQNTILGLGFAVLAMSCHKLAPQSSRLKGDDLPAENIRTQVYTVEEKESSSSAIVALMGPYAVEGSEEPLYKAVEMLGCQSKLEAYKVLGIDTASDTELLLTNEEKTALFIKAWDRLPADRETFKERFGLGQQAIDCTPEQNQPSLWYYDPTGQLFYYPNAATDEEQYFRVPESCTQLNGVLQKNFASEVAELSDSMVPDAASGKIQDLACSNHDVKLAADPWGWRAYYNASVNFNFQNRGETATRNNSLLVLSYQAPLGDALYFPILGINGQTFPDNKQKAVPQELLDEANKVIARVASMIPAIEPTLGRGMPIAMQEDFLKKIPTTPFYEVCTKTSGHCVPKAYWANQVQEEGRTSRLYELQAAAIKTSERAFIDGRLHDFLAIGSAPKLQRLALQPCAAYDLSALLQDKASGGVIPSGLEELKKEGNALSSALVLQPKSDRQISCEYPRELICRFKVHTDAEFLQAMNAANCPADTRILDITVAADINVGAPIAILRKVTASNNQPANPRFAQIGEIRIRGEAILTGDDKKRLPVISKNYSLPDFKSLLKFQGFARVEIQDLVLSSKLPSQDQSAISLLQVDEADLRQLEITSLNPITAFSNGLYILDSKLTAAVLKIKVGSNAIFADSSRILLRGSKDENWLETIRPSESNGIRLVHSLLTAQGIHVASDYLLTLQAGSVVVLRGFEGIGTSQDSSVGFYFDNANSYAILQGSPFLKDLYSVAWFETEQALESDALRAPVLGNCSNIATTSKYCK